MDGGGARLGLRCSPQSPDRGTAVGHPALEELRYRSHETGLLSQASPWCWTTYPSRPFHGRSSTWPGFWIGPGWNGRSMRRRCDSSPTGYPSPIYSHAIRVEEGRRSCGISLPTGRPMAASPPTTSRPPSQRWWCLIGCRCPDSMPTSRSAAGSSRSMRCGGMEGRSHHLAPAPRYARGHSRRPP